MKSNCNIWAWKEFEDGRTDVIVLRKTKHSRWARLAETFLWRITVRQVGRFVGVLSWVLVQSSWVLMYGRWAHVTTDTHEFVPVEDKHDRWIPPLIFKGRVKRVKDDS